MITITFHEFALGLVMLFIGFVCGYLTGNGAKDRAKNRGSSATNPYEIDTRIEQLMDKGDPWDTDDDDGTPHASYKRRDKPERRDDWARFMKEKQAHDQDHDEDQ